MFMEFIMAGDTIKVKTNIYISLIHGNDYLKLDRMNISVLSKGVAPHH